MSPVSSAGVPPAYPEQARHQVRVECDEAPQHLTIIERRAPWPEDSAAEWTRHPIARLHYTSTTTSWSLYWCIHVRD